MKFNKKYVISVLSFIVIFITIFYISTTFARFVSGVIGNDRTKVAKFVFNFNADSNVLNIPLNSLDTSSSLNYFFDITNDNGNAVSDVNSSYDMYISNSSNLPLIYKLYKYNNDTKKYDILINLDKGSSKNNSLKFNKSQTDKYMINISWDKNKKDYRYSNSIDYLLIKIKGVQVN